MGVDMLVRNCSPTLAGLKAGNIFSCAYENETAMRESMRLWNTKLVKKGLRVIPLRWQDGRALIYVYRVSRLDCDLRKEDAQCLLRERGYACDSPERCIVKLIERLRESSEFPHEIGLFLGYPPEDVKGFIQNEAGGCKLCGYWKVYGDVEAAAELFRQYRTCTEAYKEQLSKGTNIERLVIAG